MAEVQRVETNWKVVWNPGQVTTTTVRMEAIRVRRIGTQAHCTQIGSDNKCVLQLHVFMLNYVMTSGDDLCP
jgi:hypothetical protein